MCAKKGQCGKYDARAVKKYPITLFVPPMSVILITPCNGIN